MVDEMIGRSPDHSLDHMTKTWEKVVPYLLQLEPFAGRKNKTVAGTASRNC